MAERIEERSTAGASSEGRQVTPLGLANLFIVYLVWGSTYLAIRVAVRPGAGIPPFTLGFGRMTLAGVLLLALAALKSDLRRPSLRELGVLVASGLLLWTVANGMVAWAEQRVDSSLAALMIATIPLWTVVFESLLDRRRPSGRLVLFLLLGFAGAAMLSAPSWRSGERADLLSMVALVLAPVSWSLGSILQSRVPVRMPTLASAGYQQLAGGLGFAVVVILVGEPAPTPALEAWLAWGYLVLFGSLLGFSAYVYVLQSLPISIAMTYAYVNPAIAVILGALLLNESLSTSTLLGAALVLASVAGVFHLRSRRARLRKPGLA